MGSDPSWYAELDFGIRDLVVALDKAGVSTMESCQGGPGHSVQDFGYVTIGGSTAEALRALAIALETPWVVQSLSRVWQIDTMGTGMPGDPEWKLEVAPYPRVKPGWMDHVAHHRYCRQHGGNVADTDELDMSPPSWWKYRRSAEGGNND